MKTKFFFLFSMTFLVALCQSNQGQNSNISDSVINNLDSTKSIIKDTSFFCFPWLANYDYNQSLINNVSLPEGYIRVKNENASFENWLRHLPISVDDLVYLHDGSKKYNQKAQFKVVDIDIGKRDLQQCADAVMRLRAEYLYATKQIDKIHFNYTNGVNIPFSKWSSGFYPSLKGNKVVWTPSSKNNKTYKSFRKYMNNIFMYAGTASLEKELLSVKLYEVKAGNVFIKGGFPGHAVIVVDVAINQKTGDKIFMLAQSYMPAQSIHVLKNNYSELSPWYSLKEIEASGLIITPEWTFELNQLKKFEE
ncbi:MAG: DUF4846 domain-containing protein [Vicingaceae bacterium]